MYFLLRILSFHASRFLILGMIFETTAILTAFTFVLCLRCSKSCILKEVTRMNTLTGSLAKPFKYLFGVQSRNTDLTPFGREVARLRKTKKKSFYNMCKSIGVHPKTAARIERGKHPIPTDYEEQIIRYFRLRSDEALKLRKLADRQREADKQSDRSGPGNRSRGPMVTRSSLISGSMN